MFVQTDGIIYDSVRWPIFTIAYLVITIASGYILSRIIEAPSLALRDRLFPARSRPIDFATVDNHHAERIRISEPSVV